MVCLQMAFGRESAGRNNIFTYIQVLLSGTLALPFIKIVSNESLFIAIPIS